MNQKLIIYIFIILVLFNPILIKSNELEYCEYPKKIKNGESFNLILHNSKNNTIYSFILYNIHDTYENTINNTKGSLFSVKMYFPYSKTENHITCRIENLSECYIIEIFDIYYKNDVNLSKTYIFITFYFILGFLINFPVLTIYIYLKSKKEV